MKSVSVSELKAHLSECLRRVKQGERWTVTERGRPVAVLGPSPAHGGKLAELAAEGAVRLGNESLPLDFWDLPQPEDPEATVRQAVLEDRVCPMRVMAGPSIADVVSSCDAVLDR